MTTSPRLLLLDLDGTVRRPLAKPNGFISAPDDQEVIPFAAAAMRRYAKSGCTLVGITNQGGVAAGHKTLGSCLDEQRVTLNLAPHLSRILFCPDNDGARCFDVTRWGCEIVVSTFVNRGPGAEVIAPCAHFRKPEGGMLRLAMFLAAQAQPPAEGEDTVNVRAIYVGDRPEDEGAAREAGVPFLHAQDWWNSTPE